MKRLLVALLVLVCAIVSQAQLNPSQLTPFQPYQQPPYPALAGFRVMVAQGSVNVGANTVVIPAQPIYVQPNSVTYIYLNVTTGTVLSSTGGFGTGIYPIAVATSNASYVYSLVDSRPNVFNNGTGGGGGSGTVTGPVTAIVNNLVCWTSPAGLTIGDCGVAFPLPNTGLANSTFTVNTGSGLTGGTTFSLGGTMTLSLLTTCSNGQVLQWNGSTWACATNGSLTGVIAGLGLTGGGSSGSPTLSLLTSCSSGQVLQWNGSTWACAAITATPGGLTTQVQFNNVGALAGDSTFSFNSGTHTLTVQNQVINGTQTFAQPYSATTSIPGTTACTTSTVGSTNWGISSDGFLAESVNGAACADISLSGGTSIVGNPVPSQTIIQPPSTTLFINSDNNITHPIAADNWSQAPATPATLTAGSRTITLTSCPRGLWANAPQPAFANVYLTTVGTPEAAPITATTCPQVGSAAGGTITVTVANSHGAGYTVGSASQGLQEAIFAAPYTVNYYAGGVVEHGTIVVPPQQYTLQGTVFIPTPNMKIDFAGSYVTCNMAASCFLVGSIAQPNFAWDITIENLTAQPGCSNCNFPMIEDAAQHTSFIGIKAANPNPVGSKTSGFSFGSLIQVDNDQSAVIDRFSAFSARWYHCDTTFCSVAIKGAGGGGNSGIMWIKNANMNLACGANGVDNQNANTMRISDSVIQSQAQFGVRSAGVYSNVPNIELDNVYFEVAGCAGANPLGIGIAGLIVENGFASVKNSVGPLGSMQLFTAQNAGATQYNYYIVAHTSSSGGLTSAPFLAGIALTNQTGTVTVKWPQFGTTGTVTYDVIRTSGLANSPAPYTAICTGLSTTTCGSVALGLTVGAACAAVGSTNICSFTDTASTATANYTVVSPPTYFVGLPFWGGSVVWTTLNDSVGSTPSPSGVHFDRYGDNVANSAANPVSQVVSSVGALLPKFFAQHCSNMTGGVWVSCVETSNGNSSGSSSVAATVLSAGLYNGPDGAGLKGRLIFENGLPGTSIAGGHKVTLVDSNAAKTLNTAGLRPTYDANDTFIGLDNTSNVAPALAQLAFGAPVSISHYIGNVGDNTSFLERLTASLKSFTVPITTTSQITSTLAAGTAPFVVASPTRVSNLTTGGNPVLRNCGSTTTCSNTLVTNGYIVKGLVPLTGGTATVTGLPFASTTWTCVTSDNTTAANGSNMIQVTSSSQGTVTGTGTDIISYSCVGN